MLNKPVGNHAHNPQKDSNQNSREKIVNNNSFNHGAHKPKHTGIDHKKKKPERNNCHRQGQNQNDWTDQGVNQTKNQGSDQGGIKRLDMKALNKISGGKEGQGVDDPTEDYDHK